MSEAFKVGDIVTHKFYGKGVIVATPTYFSSHVKFDKEKFGGGVDGSWITSNSVLELIEGESELSFKVGDKVMHKDQGTGTIVAVKPCNGYEVMLDSGEKGSGENGAWQTSIGYLSPLPNNDNEPKPSQFNSTEPQKIVLKGSIVRHPETGDIMGWKLQSIEGIGQREEFPKDWLMDYPYYYSFGYPLSFKLKDIGFINYWHIGEIIDPSRWEQGIQLIQRGAQRLGKINLKPKEETTK